MNHDIQTSVLLKRMKSMEDSEAIGLGLEIEEIWPKLWFHEMRLMCQISEKFFLQWNQALYDLDVYEAFRSYVETPKPTYSSYHEAEAALNQKRQEAVVHYADRKMIEEERFRENIEALHFAQEDKYAFAAPLKLSWMFEKHHEPKVNKEDRDLVEADLDWVNITVLNHEEPPVPLYAKSGITKIDLCLARLFLDEMDDLNRDEDARQSKLKFSFTAVNRPLSPIPENTDSDEEEDTLFCMTPRSY